jgi:uncharacterized protein (DUF1501 family)
MANIGADGFCGDPRHVKPAGPSRREFLYVGLVGGLGLTLGGYLTQIAHAVPGIGKNGERADGGNPNAPAKSIIHIFLPGGMAAQESFDPKPYAPIEYRGATGTVKTKLEGEVFSEFLKDTAGVADKITVVRSMTHGEAAHERGTHNMFTGYRPSPAIHYPSMGAIVAHEFGPKNNLPPYVCVPSVPNEYAGTGYLPSSYGAFSLGGDPAGGNFTVRDLQLPSGVDDKRFDRRKDMLTAVDDHFRKLEKSDALDAQDTFYQRAYAMISSKEAREAFDLKAEPDAIKEKYGKNGAGMRFLMCRRLVQAGVRFVSTTYGGWDHHSGIHNAMKGQMPQFDKAFAALINDLDERGLLESTIVMVSSEFGRTPKINKDDGRDHWPKVFSIVLAGGGFKKGQIYGSSDATAAEPENDPLTVEEMASTVYSQIGVDPEKRLISPGNRPIDIVKNAKVVKELLG